MLFKMVILFFSDSTIRLTMKTILIATSNEGKKKELENSLSHLSRINQWSLKTLQDLAEPIKIIEETGSTFQENAFLKAQYYHEKTGYAVIADDSGLVVPALNGEPGIYSARYSGENSSTQNNNQKLLKKMKMVSDKTAYFITVLVFMIQPDSYYHVQGECFGEITAVLKGENGFGYDPLFFLPDLNKTMAELSLKEKEKISHRGQAIQKMIPFIEKWVQS